MPVLQISGKERAGTESEFFCMQSICSDLCPSDPVLNLQKEKAVIGASMKFMIVFYFLCSEGRFLPPTIKYMFSL